MDWIIIVGSGKRREPISWTSETHTLFEQIAAQVSGVPGVKVVPQLRRPAIFANRRLAVAGYADGIAVRLDEGQAHQALQIPGCKLIAKGRPKVVRGMVALPWSARERWPELVRAAVTVPR
jgi:hypothetical protein